MERAAQLTIPEQFDRYLRRYNDTATWLAETLDGSMLTPFEFTSDGNEIYAEDGSRLTKIFDDSIQDAERMVAEDPSLAFELRRRKIERHGELEEILQMVRGELPNTMIVESDFPPELMRGTRDVGGYNVRRKQTMSRVITWDGHKIKMYSQSLDGSNREALEAIYRHFNKTPQPGELLGQRIHCHADPAEQPYVSAHVTGVYDRSLAKQYGGAWHAGRREARRDTYQFVLSQHQLLDHFALRFMHAEPTNDERYNIAALMNQRFNAFKHTSISMSEAEIMFNAMPHQGLEWQLQQAGNEARSKGITFSGCGVSATAGDGSGPDQLSQAGYGNKARTDKYGSLTFNCPKCKKDNDRPYGRLIPNCMKCGADVSCKKPEPPKPKSKIMNKTLPQANNKSLENDHQVKNNAPKLGQKALAGSAAG